MDPPSSVLNGRLDPKFPPLWSLIHPSSANNHGRCADGLLKGRHDRDRRVVDLQLLVDHLVQDGVKDEQ